MSKATPSFVYSLSDRIFALLMGITCHCTFLLSVGLMTYALFWGLSHPFFGLPTPWRIPLDSFLLLQFPLFHSSFLTKRGQKILSCWTPSAIRQPLITTLYSLFASLQLLLVFLLWVPLSDKVYIPHGTLYYLWCGIYVGAWIFLSKAILDAGVTLQSGYLGWSSIVFQHPPRYPDLPTRGVFTLCRQPIYLGFFLVVLCAPVWSYDHLVMVSIWGAYCMIGPRYKERRFAQWYGERFEQYRESVPYFFPKIRVCLEKRQKNPLL